MFETAKYLNPNPFCEFHRKQRRRMQIHWQRCKIYHQAGSLSVLFSFQHLQKCGTKEIVTDEEIIYENKIVNRHMDANIGIMFAPRLEQTYQM